MNREPVISAAAILGLVQATVVLAVSMGWIDLSADQQKNIYAFAAACLALALPLIGGWLVRSRVTPLVDPRDEDGARLSRPDNSPTKAQVRAAQVR